LLAPDGPNNGLWFNGQEKIEYSLPSPSASLARVAPAELKAVSENYAPIFIDLRENPAPNFDVACSPGFQFMEDVPGKPGLVGLNVGDSVTIAVPQVRTGMVYIGALHSYKHMGIFRARLLVSAQSDSHGCAASAPCVPGSNGCTELAISRDSDTSWYTKISVRDTVMLPFRLPPGVNHAGCGWLTISTISNNEYSGAKTERAENKIKLLDVTFF
jgi:hypothetical protein